MIESNIKRKKRRNRDKVTKPLENIERNFILSFLFLFFGRAIGHGPAGQV